MSSRDFGCPRCGGFIPNSNNVGAYPGALSRYDNATEVCSACGQAEALAHLPREAWFDRTGYDR